MTVKKDKADNLGVSLNVAEFLDAGIKKKTPKKHSKKGVRKPTLERKCINGNYYWYERHYYRENGKLKHRDHYIGRRKPRKDGI